MLHECRQAGADERFWEGAVSIMVNNASTCALSPTDQLFHIFVHGIKWNQVPPLRWVADSMAIINHSNSQIDWGSLITQAEGYRLILPVRDGLNYLSDKLEAPIPGGVLQAIRNMPTSRMERIEYEYKTQSYLNKSLGYMPVIWFDYSRLAGNSGLLFKLIGFVKYMQSYWGARRLWELPFYAISMTKLRIRAIMDYYGKQSQ